MTWTPLTTRIRPTPTEPPLPPPRSPIFNDTRLNIENSSSRVSSSVFRPRTFEVGFRYDLIQALLRIRCKSEVSIRDKVADHAFLVLRLGHRAGFTIMLSFVTPKQTDWFIPTGRVKDAVYLIIQLMVFWCFKNEEQPFTEKAKLLESCLLDLKKNKSVG